MSKESKRVNLARYVDLNDKVYVLQRKIVSLIRQLSSKPMSPVEDQQYLLDRIKVLELHAKDFLDSLNHVKIDGMTPELTRRLDLIHKGLYSQYSQLDYFYNTTHWR